MPPEMKARSSVLNRLVCREEAVAKNHRSRKLYFNFARLYRASIVRRVRASAEGCRLTARRRGCAVVYGDMKRMMTGKRVAEGARRAALLRGE